MEESNSRIPEIEEPEIEEPKIEEPKIEEPKIEKEKEVEISPQKNNHKLIGIISAMGLLIVTMSVVLVMVISNKGCNHNFVGGSCTERKVCENCGQASQETPQHSYDAWKIDKEATCISTGSRSIICTKCAYTFSETLPISENHSYNEGTITKKPTCTSQGVKTLTCSLCNKTETMNISALGHTANGTGKCSTCGILVLNLTTKQIEDSKQIEKMSHSVGEYSSYFSVNITLKDDNDYAVHVPVYVKVRIVDDNGNVLYDNTVIKKESQDSVKINHSELLPGETEIGTLYYKVYNDYVSFDELSKEITDLPWTVDIKLPILPKTISDNGWNGSACKITDIRYEVSGDDLYIYFTGEKTFDEEGVGYSQSCKIGWKLYDSDGYVVEDGTCYTSSLKVGEKFKDSKDYAFDVIQKGKTYKLEILDLD